MAKRNAGILAQCHLRKQLSSSALFLLVASHGYMRDENHSFKFQQLRDTTHHNYGRTAEADFALAFTFRDMAETECRMGNAAHAKELITQSWRALETAERYAAKSDLPSEKITDLQRRLNTLRQELLKLEEEAA